MVPCPADFLSFGEQLRDSIRLKSLLTSTLKVGKGSDVYRCGDHDDNVYLIESGQIKIQALSHDAKGCLLAIYTAGDLFGELCLTGGSRVETATAMKDSVLKKIRCDNFLRRLTQDVLHEAFLKYVVLRIAEQQKIIRNLVTADSEHRLAATLLQLTQKLGRRDTCSLRIQKRISHQEFSEMVGTTRSRIGHFLQKFRDLGLIVSDPEGFLIVKEASLEAYLEAYVDRRIGHSKK
jgi:CRP/FNR family cyclic AMP-dependent transcriptional regulator